jgi:O-acetyl-ADP-ribose deacetylase (regulator of RNase III)
MSLLVTKTGNMFDEPFDALVDPVNCIGVHGKGLAKEFAKRYPRAIAMFNKKCNAGEVKRGNVYMLRESMSPWIIFFPTKGHWREASEYMSIELGLESLVTLLKATSSIKSVAIPALGCGLGGLDWSVVRPMIQNAASQVKADVTIFNPE